MEQEPVDKSEEADYEFEVPQSGEKTRLDTLVCRLLQEEADAAGGVLPGCGVVPTRSKVAQWIVSGFVQVNYQAVTRSAACAPPGALLSIAVPPARTLVLEPDSTVAIEAVYEDAELLVLNKPAGVVVHPGAGQERGTLVQGLLAYLGDELRQVGDALRPGIVHRLDKDTSGLMVVAKTDRAYQALVRQFLPPRTICRKYLALTTALPVGNSGALREESGVIELPIGRHPGDRKKMGVVTTGGRAALTEWRIVERLRHGFLLELSLGTGRTHQIRVHLQQMNAPIVGDPIYGRPPASLPQALRAAVKSFGRQALHAQKLSFLHPTSGGEVSFVAPIPENMQQLIECFR
ncbi:MAG TPA: RluA family pseudouridine synthase [Oligoflexia bacterium]|nr:RluA family pseudouridine synthase [Oligoflexia bacterium]